MHYLDCSENVRHVTGDFPLAYYFVDENFPRYRMPMHWHRETEIIHVRNGKLLIYLDDREITAEAGDIISVGSGVIHGADPENCIYECIVFSPDVLLPPVESLKKALIGLQRNNIFFKSGVVAADPAFQQAAENLFRLCREGFIGRETDMMAVIFAFMGGACRNAERAQTQIVSERTWQKAEQLKPALEYIEQHYSRHISLETLAKMSGFSPKYFCRYFRAIVHRSPIDYLNYYRIECAARYLTTHDLNVAEIAVMCGYADSSAFIKQFHRYKGTTPKQYKMRMTAQTAEAT